MFVTFLVLFLYPLFVILIQVSGTDFGGKLKLYSERTSVNPRCGCFNIICEHLYLIFLLYIKLSLLKSNIFNCSNKVDFTEVLYQFILSINLVTIKLSSSLRILQGNQMLATLTRKQLILSQPNG